MTTDRKGQVVTFYSYKGGTGRTMALANVAWILAANGKRVLVVDWDLESPGLDRFFRPFMDMQVLTTTGGVIQLIRDYEMAAGIEHSDPDWYVNYARVHQHSFSLDWPHFPAEGGIDFLSAGLQNNDYAGTIAGLNWDDFYERQGGGVFLDALRADMKRHYDYTLIDSRTGFSDVADICTLHLPDVLVDCFTLSEQGIEGAWQVARRVQRGPSGEPVRIFPVPMRVDPAEKIKADTGRMYAKQRFAGLPTGFGEVERDAYWAGMQVPYQAFYAYEESLATFGDATGDSGTLLAAYETLTRHLTRGAVISMPPMKDAMRSPINARFVRQPQQQVDEILLSYVPPDQVWAEWIEHMLVAVGVRVFDPWGRPDRGDAPASAQTLRVVSRTNANAAADAGPGREPLLVYVADAVASLSGPGTKAVMLAGLNESQATVQLFALVGRAGASGPAPSPSAPRYPGTDAPIFNAQARNARFTGREEDLRRLRAHLRHGAVMGAEAPTAVLHGMGGIGKTHVALEYAHRFRAAYDLVWWVTADPFTFVDSQLIDLANEMRLPPEATGPNTTRAALASLARGEPSDRWLLIFDNVEDARAEKFLPRGKGHVLITSRDSLWRNRAADLPLDVFERSESIALLHKRVPNLSDRDADRVADTLGDLPVAVAAAGAWLEATGAAVDEYLDAIERQGPGVLIQEGQPDTRVEATWTVSLDLLRERSPAAYRLLELCSVMSPEIALELVYSDNLAAFLTKFDPALSERMMRGALVQQIHRLALLRIDQTPGDHVERPAGGQILVHRLLQRVVRSRMSPEDLERTRHEIHLVLSESRPDSEVDTPDSWPRFRILWPHLEASEAITCDDPSVRRLLIDRVRYLWIRGDYDRGEQRAVAAEAAWEARLAESKDPEFKRLLEQQLLHLKFNRGNILRSRGDFRTSLTLDESLLKRQTKLHGGSHPYTLLTAGGLAGDLRGLGRYQEALERDKVTYAAWLNNWGEDHPRTLAALNNVAASHRLMGEFKLARERDEQAFERRRVVLGESHQATFLTWGNLARDLRDLAELDRSIAMLRALVDAATNAFGEASRDALVARSNLAVSLRAAGRLAEAADMLDLTVEALIKSAGPTSWETRAARLSRGVTMLALRQFDRARTDLQDVRDAYKASYGSLHPHTLVCESNLALVARGTGELDQAVKVSETVAERFAAQLTSEHPFTLDAQTNLAVCLADREDLVRGHELLTEILPRITEVYGTDHPVTLRCRANLSVIGRRWQPDTRAGEPDGLAALAARLGAQHPSVVELLSGRLVHRAIDPHPF